MRLISEIYESGILIRQPADQSEIIQTPSGKLINGSPDFIFTPGKMWFSL